MFDILTGPFTTALLLLYRILGQNTVLTIVVFTILVRLLTYPLNAQQIKSAKAMQELQPKLKKLQEKYKGNREQLSQEQMKLYQEHGVNPLAGCLPLLIQFPILIGLYSAIMRALATSPLQLLDLYHRILIPGLSALVPMQNKFLWLNLAAPDQYFILPVLVVATTWLQQKLMTPPTTGDSNDASAAMSRNMQIMMPLMIGWFSLQFASGLSIYWVIGNIVGIAQYAAMGRIDIKNLFGGWNPFARGKQAVIEPVDDEPKSKKKALATPIADLPEEAVAALPAATPSRKKSSRSAKKARAKQS
ncbi:MAG TPA: YidC/Oxa1 family membrane protein insertase [Aggregatilineales bacterium]|nr:YidC/Oxa1 family membrane protein insertase [Aggregatilineales bacterium]